MPKFKFSKTQLLNSFFNKLSPLTSLLLIAFSFLMIKNNFNWKFLIITIILFLMLILQPIWIIISIFFTILFYLIWHLGECQIFYEKISGNFKVKKIVASYPVISYQGSNIILFQKGDWLIGDQIYVDGKIEPPFHSTKNFLENHKIYGSIFKPKLFLTSPSNSIRSKIIRYVLKGPKFYKKYLALILFGQKQIHSMPFFEQAIKMNIVHLIVVSGFHINILFYLFKKIVSFLGFSDNIAIFTSIFIIFFYVYLLNFSIPALRSFLTILIWYLNLKLWKKFFNRFNILMICALLILIFNPMQISSLSFVMSFLASFIIAIALEVKIKHKITKYLFINLMVYFFMWPISVYVNQQFNALAYFFNLIFSPILGTTYLISFFFLPFKNILNLYFWFFDSLISCFTIFYINFNFNLFNSEILILIYLFWFFIIYSFQQRQLFLYNSFIGTRILEINLWGKKF